MKRKFWFGKYKDREIVDIINEDYQYVRWCLNNISSFVLNEEEMKLYQSKKPVRIQLVGLCSELDFSDYDDYTFGFINCSDDM